jgi:hypothetical protein
LIRSSALLRKCGRIALGAARLLYAVLIVLAISAGLLLGLALRATCKSGLGPQSRTGH